MVMGAENAMPSMARPTRSVARFFANAQGRTNATATNSVDTLEVCPLAGCGVFQRSVFQGYSLDDLAAVHFREGSENQWPFSYRPSQRYDSSNRSESRTERGTLTNTESYDEKSNAEEGDFIAGMELFGHALDVRRDDRRCKGDDEAGNGDDHGDVPFIRLAPILGVFRVVVVEGDEAIAVLTIGFDWTWDLALSCFDNVFVEVGCVRQGPVG